MTIGFDGSRCFNKDRTGTENYSYQLLRALSKIDHKNHYAVYLRPGSTPGKDWPKNFQFKSINFPRLWTQAGLASQTFKEKLDVLFIPAHTSPLVHKPGLKTVVTVHDLGAEYLPKAHQLKQQLYLKWITKFQLKSATKLIAVSRATKNDLVKKVGVNPQKIEVIYEGYDQKLFKRVEDLSRAKSRDDTLVNSLTPYSRRDQGSERSEGSYFLFVGTVQPRKNLERLIKAFHLFSQQALDFKLVIAGSKGWLADEIYSLPKRLGIEKQVKFLGYVPDENLPTLYSGATALVFPSLFEGFGLPIIEAQACGTPVLTSNISSMPEVANKGAILVDPYKVEEIASGMMKMIDNKMRDGLIKEGFENIKRFSWEKCARETLKVLESLL